MTLSGQVDTYHKKLEAEKKAKKVPGVKTIAEDIHMGVSNAIKNRHGDRRSCVARPEVGHLHPKRQRQGESGERP